MDVSCHWSCYGVQTDRSLSGMLRSRVLHYPDYRRQASRKVHIRHLGIVLLDFYLPDYLARTNTRGTWYHCSRPSNRHYERKYSSAIHTLLSGILTVRRLALSYKASSGLRSINRSSDQIMWSASRVLSASWLAPSSAYWLLGIWCTSEIWPARLILLCRKYQ